MHKIVLAITGASGAIYSRQLLNKLLKLNNQWKELAVVMTDNARLVWKTELGNEDYSDFKVPFYGTTDFLAPFASGFGSIQYHDHRPLLHGYFGTHCRRYFKRSNYQGR